MIKLNKIAMMVATVAVAGAAFANGSTTNSDNWRSGPRQYAVENRQCISFVLAYG